MGQVDDPRVGVGPGVRTLFVAMGDLPPGVVGQSGEDRYPMSPGGEAVGQAGCVRRDSGGFGRVVESEHQYSKRIVRHL